MNARTFLEIVKSIEETQIEINVDQKTQVVTIKSSKDTFDINGLAASEYVALPEVPRNNTVNLDTQTFSTP
ncbi:TPA: hypothetical protein DEP21_01965 [Patescibacteria group bacterium]|nr:hypothetical protein [Candidatus Gracilibacteria bacterium]